MERNEPPIHISGCSTGYRYAVSVYGTIVRRLSGLYCG